MNIRSITPLLIILLSLTFPIFGQVQLDQYVTGEEITDGFGQCLSLSSDGLRMAIGAPSNDEAYYNSGHVRVYDYINGKWTQIGSDIDGERAGDGTGMSLSLSGNGEVLAIGSSENSEAGHASGKVRIFRFESGDWVKIGQDLKGENALGFFGGSISLSDNGNRIIIGEIGNNKNGSYAGKAHIFEYDGSSWLQLGQELLGNDISDKFGDKVAMTGDGNSILISAPGGGFYGESSVFEFNGTAWVQKGDVIDTTIRNLDISSDGLKIVLSDYLASRNGTSSGRVRVFELNGSNWLQRGQDINGDEAHFQAGISLSLASNGDRVTVTMANRFEDIKGLIRTYDFNTISNTWLPYGLDIINTSGTISAMVASHSGDIIAHGSIIDAYDNYGEYFVNTFDISADQSQGYNLVEGFARLNSNNNDCAIDAVPIGNLKIEAIGDNLTKSDFTDPNGYFKILVPSGNYSLQIGSQLPIGTISPNAIPFSFTASDDTQTLNFCINSNVKLDNKLELGFRSNFTGNQSLILSSDGNRMAVGFPDYDAINGVYQQTYGQGRVQVYEYNNNGWTPLGQEIVGGSGKDGKGWSLTFSEDGNRLAIASPVYDQSYWATDRGRITIYDYNGNEWVQIGQEIIGEFDRGLFGSSIDLSADGNSIIIGNKSYGSNVSGWGRSSVYVFDGNTWNKKGSPIQGSSYSYSGNATSISADGSIIAIGASLYTGADDDYLTSAQYRGQVRLFQFDETVNNWVQLGQGLYGENDRDQFGTSIELSSDGQMIAIGAQSQYDKGYASVYTYNGTNWVQKGNSIPATLPGDTFGHSISMSNDGNLVSIGGPEHDPEGPNNQIPGYARVFKYNGGEWTQFSPDIHPPANVSNFGLSVSLSGSGNKLAVKSFEDVFIYNLNYEITPLSLEISITPNSCDNPNEVQVLLSANGGVPNYEYSLSNGPFRASNIYEGVTSGTYTATLRDAIGTVFTQEFTVNLEPITIAALAGKGECLADPQDGIFKSGTIEVTPSGGTPPYQSNLRTIYGANISPSENDPFFYEGLGEGFHIVTVTDNTGCSKDYFIEITDSSCPTAELQFASSIEVNEGSQSLTIPFELSGEITDGFTVDYTINALTAENTTDFVAESGTLTFAGNNEEIQNITVSIIDDNVIEVNEKFNIILSNQSSTDVLLLVDMVIATISDNDLIPGSSGISFETSNAFIDEDAEFAMLNVTLVGNVQESFTVDYSTQNNEAQSVEDYITTSGTLTFTGFDGESQQISIPIVNDNIAEIQESFSVSLSNLSTTLIPIIENIATVSINDNSIGTPLSITNWELSEITCRGANDASILVNISGGTAPYNFSLQDQLGNIIEDVQDNNLFENLPSGDYYISVEDATNESVTGTLINISEPTLITAEYMIGNASCSATSDGTVEIVATGGSGSFEYSLDGITFNPGNTFNNLIAGNYDIFVRDSNGCLLLGQFSILLNDGVDYDNDGIYDSCDTDIDGDGVLNEIDECPETPLGIQVNTRGCENFTLPNDAISIKTTSESCADSNNGSILITTDTNMDYVATLTNSNDTTEIKEFRSFASFQDLNAGNYNVCVTINGETDFERCFAVNIDEPEPLSVSGKLDPSGKSITFKMSGGDSYYITINDETTTTLLNEITIPISDTENVIEVKTDKDCQGVFNDNIIINTSELLIYPNPVTNGELFVTLPNSEDENTLIALYTSNGSLVMQNVLNSNETTLRLNVQGLTTGVYNLKIETSNKTEYRRILIK